MKPALVAASLLCLPLATAAHGAELKTTETYPTVDAACEVSLEGHDAPHTVELTVVYRPNSATTVEAVIGTFSADGTLSWTPDQPGITTLVAAGPDGKKVASRAVATRFSDTPIAGVVVMLLAGLLLFGGAGYSLRRALADQ